MFDYPKKALYLLITFIVLSLVVNSCIKSSKQQPPTVSEPSNVEVIKDVSNILSTQSVITTLLPTSYTTINGSDGGQPVNNMHDRDQNGQDNNWNKYVEFKTPSGNNYEGYQSYFLPTDTLVADITSLIITINFLGPDPGWQTWLWEIHNWENSTWLTLGNNANASWDNGWTELTFGIQGILDDYVSTEREIRIRLLSMNAKDNADIDYQTITVMGDSIPISNEITLNPISYTTTSGGDGKQSVGNLYVQDQQGDDNDWERYLEFKTPQESLYAGYRSYTLPNHLDGSKLTSITLKANFLGPNPVEQEWLWSIYHWNTSTWVNLGNNEGASWEGGWKEFSYEASGNLSEYVAQDRKIRIQIASDNNVDNADLDYEALVASTVGSEPLPEPWQRINLEGEGISTYDASTDTFNLKTKALSGKNSHYVYQEISNDFTIQGCIQNLISNDPEAKAGIMLRQDNTNTSEYVYVYSSGDRTEVE